MHASLQELVNQVRLHEDDAAAFDRLVGELRDRAGPADVVELLRAGADRLRCAAVLAAAGRAEPDVAAAAQRLVHDPVPAVREALAAALEQAPGWLPDAALEHLLRDGTEGVRQVAARAARHTPGLLAELLHRVGHDEAWRVRLNAAESLGHHDPRRVLPALLAALHTDGDSDVRLACGRSVEKHLAALGDYPRDVDRPPYATLAAIRKKVEEFKAGYYPRFLAWLDTRLNRDVDFEALRQFGTVLSDDAERAKLPRAHGVDELCANLRAALTGGDGPRAAVLLGESGTGKTAVVNELIHRLADDPDEPWHVLRVTPTEFLAGTTYLGEWQTKLKNLIQAIQAPRRVILYVPTVSELAMIGTTNKSDANVATSLAPHVERGGVAVLGESTPDAYRSGLGAVASVSKLFQAFNVAPRTPDETRSILRAVCDESGIEAPDGTLDRLTELADSYLAGMVQPGRSVGLLRRVLARQAGPVTTRGVLETLSASTGIPVDFLDDAVPLDPAKVREHIEARIMGQPEAVEAMVDLVTMVKAGLCDPNKPLGVFLFVGPSGVGKTEMARTVAGLIFGDPARLIRLDMTEFSNYDAHERLIGWGTRPGLLTSPVREQPFSVVLLDEIEKAHGHAYDLCLQIFDAGRLTDTQGRTTDFRRTIIIMTSNIGSSGPQSAPIGFDRTPATPSRDSTQRALGRWFRPEFLNRIDQVVPFRPLSAESAAQIAQLEVRRVLERGGIVRRRLAVDIDPSVLQLLLREGYSPTLGARPLKRAVERLLLLPVARSVAVGSVPTGSVLRLVARNDKVYVSVSRPELPEAAEPPDATRAASALERVAALAGQAARLREAAAPLAERKSAGVAQTSAAGFWDDRGQAQGVWDEIYRLEGVLTALAELEKAVAEQAEHIAQHRADERALAAAARRLDGLERQAAHVEFLVSARDPRDLADAFVILTRVSAHGAALDGLTKLAGMYLKCAKRRGLNAEVLSDRAGGDGTDDIVLLVSGAGAFALLAGETGLHQLTSAAAATEPHRPADREVVRVEVLRYPAGPGLPSAAVRLVTRPLTGVTGRLLAKPKFEAHLLHRPTLLAIRAWCSCAKGEIAERLQPLLQARVEAAEVTGDTPAVVRRYRLGPTTHVKDHRTGRGTARLDRVLAGDLDLFLTPAGSY